MQNRPYKVKTPGFTLVEILVVLAIIGMLAALLFPAFGRMQERAMQTTCISNLKQIGVAVRQYYLDEKAYPSSLTILMPASTELDNDPTTTNDNVKGANYLTSLDIGKCPDDDTDGAMRHSYGQYGVNPATALTTGTAPTDGGQYVWNYWGYRDDGYAYQSPSEAATAQGAGPNYPFLVNKTLAYSHPLLPSYSGNKNVVEKSLSNRYAPPNTIITHCIYHRMTTSNVNSPTELYYLASPTADTNAKDLVLLLDSTVKTLDVANFRNSGPGGVSQWQAQSF